MNNPADFNFEPKHVRLDLSDNFLITDDLYGNHLKLKLRPSKHFYFQVDYFALVEKVSSDNEYASLNLYNFCYDRLRFNKFNLGWTMGVNYVASSVGKGGFTYGLNSEVFLPKSISFSASFRASKINEQPVNEFEILGRYHKNRFFVCAGYEFIRIASNDLHFIAFGAGVCF